MRSYLFLSFFLLSISFSQARTPRGDYTLLLIPSRHGAVQIGRDLEERLPILLMTYDPLAPKETLFLHVWRDLGWVNVPAGEFSNGTFLQRDPARVIVVGPASAHVSSLVQNAIAWSPEVLNLESEDPVELLNAYGRLFEFRARDWHWFAGRYGLELEDMNEGQPRLSWYDEYVASDLPPPTSPFRRRRDSRSEEGMRPLIRLEPVPEDTGTTP